MVVNRHPLLRFREHGRLWRWPRLQSLARVPWCKHSSFADGVSRQIQFPFPAETFQVQIVEDRPNKASWLSRMKWNASNWVTFTASGGYFLSILRSLQKSGKQSGLLLKTGDAKRIERRKRPQLGRIPLKIEKQQKTCRRNLEWAAMKYAQAIDLRRKTLTLLANTIFLCQLPALHLILDKENTAVFVFTIIQRKWPVFTSTEYVWNVAVWKKVHSLLSLCL